MGTAVQKNSGAIVKFKTSLLMTTALTVAGLLVTTTAYADPAANELPTGFNLQAGSVNDPSVSGNTMGIQQNSLNAVIDWNTFNIGKDATVNFDQTQGKNSLVVNRVSNTTVNKTEIFGALNAQGRVMILDRNGVLIGKGASINVAGLIAATGKLDAANQDALMNGRSFALSETDANPGARVENQGTINIAEAGLLAFVAPYVSNSGLINATLGKVTLASGKKVTVDLTGDNLITIAADDKLTKAYVENSGTINANGGRIVMTASAAGDAVNSVVNMSGVARADSYSAQQGKIVLSSSGSVSVAGTVSANGGGISLAGHNLFLEAAGILSADGSGTGNGGTVCVIADNYAIIEGRISARGGAEGGDGGFVETSGGEGVLFYGLVDTTAANGATGRFLLDPVNISLGSYSLATQVADIAADLLAGGTKTTVKVDGQSLANTLALTNVDLWATKAISTTANLDLSTWKGLFGTKGITTHDLTLSADTININNDITLGKGALHLYDIKAGTSPLGLGLIKAPADIAVNILNLNGTIKTRTTTSGPVALADYAKIDGAARTVNVLSNSAKIQQGISFAHTGATVNVAAGTYDEDVLVNKEGLTLLGTAAVITPHSPGFYVTEDNTTVDGFTINGSGGGASDGYGIWVDHANNVTLTNNVIQNTSLDGIFADTSDNLTAQGNTITNSGNGHTWNDFSFPNGSGSGIQVLNSSGSVIGGEGKGEGNTITTAAWDGIRISGGTASVIDNIISGVGRVGVWLNNVTGTKASGNTVHDTGLFGIGSDFNGSGTSLSITENIIYNTGAHAAEVTDELGMGDGIKVDGVVDSTISGNLVGTLGVIGNIQGDGIGVYNGDGVTIADNTVNNYAANGVFVDPSFDISVTGNTVTGGVTGIKVLDTVGVDILGNEVSNMSGDGIYVTNSNDITIASLPQVEAPSLKNWVHNVGGKGISVVGSTAEGKIFTTSLSIADNTVEVTGQEGIFVSNVNGDGETNTVKISGNDVGGNSIPVIIIEDPSTGIGNSGVYDGIRLQDSSNALIDGDNTVYGTTGNGIGVYDSSNVGIDDNYVHNSGRNGILVDPSSNVSITDNTIDNNADDGIFADQDTNLTITGNTITNSGTAHQWWDGSNKGSGIQVLNSTGTVIGGTGDGDANTITTAAWDGIRVSGGDASVIDNVVSFVGRVGIWLNNVTGSTVSGNTVHDTGLFGIGSDFNNPGATDDLTIAGNTVDHTGTHGNTDEGMGDGIKVDGVTNLTIKGNTVGQNGGGIAGDGIGVLNTDNVDILGNIVTAAAGDGIFVTDSNHITITGYTTGEEDETVVHNNWVYGVGGNGIRVKGYVEETEDEGTEEGTLFTTDLLVSDNTVESTGLNGIYVSGIQGRTLEESGVSALISDNDVGGEVVSDTGIGGDGIRVEDSSYVTVNGNSVYDTDANGIGVYDSNHILVNDNDIDETDGSGIFVDPSDSITVSGNFVVDAFTNGITMLDTSNGVITGNGVSHTVTGDGIFVGNSDGAVITGNGITGAGRDGIHAENSDDLTITGNAIVASEGSGFFAFIFDLFGSNGASRDGINVSNSDGSDVSDNFVLGTLGDSFEEEFFGGGNLGAGRDGIRLEGFTNGTANGNVISVTDLVDTDGLPPALRPDEPLLAGLFDFPFPFPLPCIFGCGGSVGGDGISLRNGSGVTIDGNTINNYGDDGIQVSGSGSSKHEEEEDDASGDIFISSNVIDGDGESNTGIRLWDNEESQQPTLKTLVFDLPFLDGPGGDAVFSDNGDIHVIGNTVTGNGVGLDASAFDNQYIELSGNTFTDNTTGAWFASGLIDLTGAGNTFNGGDTALLFQRAEQTVPGDFELISFDEEFGPFFFEVPSTTVFADLNLVGNTIGTTVFNGQSTWYADLENGALFDPGTPTIIDGTHATYDGVSGGLMTSDQLAAIEDKLHDFVDDGIEGLFFPGFTSNGGGEDNSDIFQIINGAGFNPSNPFVIITGLPDTGGGGGGGGGGTTTFADLNNIETAAGGPDDLANIEPAAGGGNATSVACWGNVSGALTGKNVVSLNLGGDAGAVLDAQADCADHGI